MFDTVYIDYETTKLRPLKPQPVKF